jgi:PAS domain S-box-containing protein
MPRPLRILIAEGPADSADDVRALVPISVTDVLFFLGVEGSAFRFQAINRAFTTATGLTEEQVVGRLVDDVIPEPSLQLVLSKYREAVSTAKTVRWEEITEYPTGRKYGEISVTPVVAADGQCTGLVGTVHDVTEQRQQEELIRLYADVVSAVQIGLCVWQVGEGGEPRSITLAASNPEAERTSTIPLSSLVGHPLLEVFPADAAAALLALVRSVAADQQIRALPEFRFVDAPDSARLFAVKGFPLAGGRVGLAFEDVSAQARVRSLNAAEQRVLELTASGATLEATLTTLALAIEELTVPAMASVLLLSPDGTRVLHGAAPNLPAAYSRAINGEAIGPNAGSCGTAAALKQPVIVTDIELDPRWAAYRDVARQAGLRACWSTPIFASEGRVLGTFALYYREPRSPSPADLEIIARATHVAGLAIQRQELDQQLRDLTARIEAEREDERTGVAREIHDQLGQSLTALKMDLAWISRRARAESGLNCEALLEKVSELSRMTDDIIQQVRRISSDLRPGVLDDIGLVAALQWQAQEFEKRTHISCTVRSSVSDEAVNATCATVIFRVFQEALTNIVRHAQASQVSVTLEATGGSLVLLVRDDGKGIRPESIHDPSSLGLLGIRERARRLGGTARFARARPTGTEVELSLPLDACRTNTDARLSNVLQRGGTSADGRGVKRSLRWRSERPGGGRLPRGPEPPRRPAARGSRRRRAFCRGRDRRARLADGVVAVADPAGSPDARAKRARDHRRAEGTRPIAHRGGVQRKFHGLPPGREPEARGRFLPRQGRRRGAAARSAGRARSRRATDDALSVLQAEGTGRRPQGERPTRDARLV